MVEAGAALKETGTAMAAAQAIAREGAVLAAAIPAALTIEGATMSGAARRAIRKAGMWPEARAVRVATACGVTRDELRYRGPGQWETAL